jgi:putative ABC transport system ATP-binding protein
MKPGLLLADEPTGNLDSRSGDEVIDILEQLNHDGISLMVVTHDIDIGRRAHRHLALHDGEIVKDEGTA